jgi:hypothetical protein
VVFILFYGGHLGLCASLENEVLGAVLFVLDLQGFLKHAPSLKTVLVLDDDTLSIGQDSIGNPVLLKPGEFADAGDFLIGAGDRVKKRLPMYLCMAALSLSLERITTSTPAFCSFFSPYPGLSQAEQSERLATKRKVLAEVNFSTSTLPPVVIAAAAMVSR